MLPLKISLDCPTLGTWTSTGAIFIYPDKVFSGIFSDWHTLHHDLHLITTGEGWVVENAKECMYVCIYVCIHVYIHVYMY